MALTRAQRMSAAAHRDLPHANPLSSEQFDSLVKALADERPREVLDVGCGWGSFAIALAQVSDASIIGVDINTEFLARARSSSTGSKLIGSIDFRETSVMAVTNREFDAVACIGSAQAFGTTRQAVERCAALLRDDGILLFADGVWEQAPPQEFLDFLGIGASTYWLREEAEAVFERAGLIIRRQEVTSALSWSAYEDAIHAGRLRFAGSLDREEADAVRARTEAWTAAWQRWGRHYLGFVAYLASRPV